MMFWISFFITLLIQVFLVSVSLGITKNIALNKPAQSSNPRFYSTYYNPKNGVDGNLNSFAFSNGGDAWFLVDLQDDFRVHYVQVHNRKDCCGDRLGYFKIGLLKLFKEKSFQTNMDCGQYQGETVINQMYQVQCMQPFSLNRYVLLQGSSSYKDIGFTEFEVYGDDKDDYSSQYVGCYSDLVSESNPQTVTTVDQCIYTCSNKFSLYAAVQEGECFCENNLGQLVPSSECNLTCSDDDHFCGANNRYSFYRVKECSQDDKPVACTQHCKQSNGSDKCLCEATSQNYCRLLDCNSSNGLCGDNPCVSFKIGTTQLSECGCKLGYHIKTYYYSLCEDIDECKEKNPCDQTTSTCNNTEGSFVCECKSGYENSSGICQETDSVERTLVGTVVGTIVGVLVLLIIVLLFFCLIKRHRINKRSELPPESGTDVKGSRLEEDGVKKIYNFNFILNKIYNKNISKSNISDTTNITSNVNTVNIAESVTIDNVDSFTAEIITAMGNTGVRQLSESRIKLEDLEDFYNNNRAVIISQFNEIQMTCDKEIVEGRKNKTKTKKMYKDILPFDFNRVKLSSAINDYINASYIKSFHSTDYQFIATQGIKKEEDIEDFWKMVLQEQVVVIIMLTPLIEEQKTKCLQYWPDSGTKEYGAVKVDLKEVMKWPTFEIRKLLVTQNGSDLSLLVHHMFYLKWPDHGVPCNVASLLNFHHKGKQFVQKKLNLLEDNTYESDKQAVSLIVHCSAGVGRTGTMIGIDYLIEEGKQSGFIDPLSCLKDLRRQRNKMIQNEKQFLFCHKVLTVYGKIGNTTIYSKKDDSLNTFLSGDQDKVNDVLQNQIYSIEENLCIVESLKNSMSKSADFEYYPSFSRPQAFRLCCIEDVSESLFLDLLPDSCFVLVLHQHTLDHMNKWLPELNQRINSKNFFVTKINEKSCSRYVLQIEKNNDVKEEVSYKDVYENTVPCCQTLSIECASINDDIMKCYKNFSKQLLDSNEPPVLILYSTQDRQECLWSLVKFHLLEMMDKHAEVDVYQSVYNIYNCPSATHNFSLTVDSYKHMHQFALELLQNDHMPASNYRNSSYDDLENPYENDDYQKTDMSVINETVHNFNSNNSEVKKLYYNFLDVDKQTADTNKKNSKQKENNCTRKSLYPFVKKNL